jgi:hypothetical protein
VSRAGVWVNRKVACRHLNDKLFRTRPRVVQRRLQRGSFGSVAQFPPRTMIVCGEVEEDE